MTGIRYSVSVAREDEFGKGAGDNDFFTLSAGGYMSATYNVSTETVYSPGSKFFDTAIYGRGAGSFEIDFVLSYEYLELLGLVFEDYDVEPLGNGRYRHTFRKVNNARVPSFVIRRKTLNRITGPTAGKDECVDFVGCIVKSFRVTQSSGSSKLSVTVSGYFKEALMDLSNLTSTDFKEFDGQPVEWACALFDDEYVSNVESLTLAVDNNGNMQYTTCNGKAINYYEDRASFQFGLTTYSNDPLRIKARTFTGGQDPELSKESSGTYQGLYRDMCKNKHPLDSVRMLSYDTCSSTGGSGVLTAYENAPRSVAFNIGKCIVKSATWQKGDGSRMLDQISSAECRNIEVVIVNDIESYKTIPSAHKV